MALSDDQKTALEWAALVPGVLRAIGKATGDKGFDSAADVLSAVSVDQIGSTLGTLRTDRVSIESGAIEISDGVDAE